MPILFGIPFLAEAIFGTVAIGVVAAGASSVADSSKKGADAASQLVKEVVVPIALIYGGYLWLQSKKS
jgi:hypothetical protein